MYNGLLHAHSGWRWVVLVLLLAAIVQAFAKMRANESITDGNRKLHLFAMIASHIQLVFGLILLFISPKVNFQGMENEVTRFFSVEHTAAMLIALVLITVGYSKAKRNKSFKTVFWFYLLGLVLILAMIPWPFMNYGGSWF